jgi:WbqC-like protein family
MLRHIAYLPPLEWFALSEHDTTITLEAMEHYQKGSSRNRCLIAGSNGVQRLSIPLEKGKHQQTPIRSVRIAYHDNWPMVHWRSIQSAYGNAPFFEYYADELNAIYTKKPEFLFDFNVLLLEFVIKKAKWQYRLDFSNTYTPFPPAPVASYTPKRYPQVFEDRFGFQPDLSVLDALMCCGNNIPL